MRYPLACAAALVLGAAGCRNGGGDAKPASDEAFRTLAPGDTVPAYAVETLVGDTMRFGTGQPVTLLNIWATWCTSCREEMSDLIALHDEFGSHGLRVVAVSVDQGGRDHVARFAWSQKLNFPVGLDPSGEIQQQYAVVSVPTTFLIAADGRLIWKRSGNLHPVVADARARVTSALDAGAPRPGS